MQNSNITVYLPIQNDQNILNGQNFVQVQNSNNNSIDKNTNYIPVQLIQNPYFATNNPFNF